MNHLATAERRYDRRTPEDVGVLTDLANKADMPTSWPVNKLPPLQVTESEIQAVIEQISETGFYDNDLGQPVAASKLHRALANVWADDPMLLYGEINTEFYDWVASLAWLAKFGKR